jgi:hypothetical protein
MRFSCWRCHGPSRETGEFRLGIAAGRAQAVNVQEVLTTGAAMDQARREVRLHFALLQNWAILAADATMEHAGRQMHAHFTMLQN